jgi:hypothetical protein
MVDGISCCLGYLRSDQKEKIIYASKTSGLGDEAMRALRQGYGAYEIWRTLGGCLGFPETALLLASMCEQSWKLGTVVLGSLSDIPKVREAVLRALRQFESSPCTSQEWKPSRQCVDKFRDALCELPPEASQIAGAAVTYPLIRNAPARMGRLRGYGNAIVPQLAAQFVTAFAEATA